MKFSFIHAKTTNDIPISAHDAPVHTIGVEVTDAAIVACLNGGNLDGQHGHGVDWIPRRGNTALVFPPFWQGKAAIEIAMMFDWDACVYCNESHADGFGTTRCGMYSPPRSPMITLATSRPDLDSIGAMAVLVLRSIGLAKHIDLDLVAAIAAADSFRSGTWTSCPLPTKENPWPRGPSTVDSTRETAGLGMICSPRKGDFCYDWTLAERVFVIAWALQQKSVAYIDQSQLADRWTLMNPIARACNANTTIDADHALGTAFGDVYESRRALAKAAHEPGALTDRGSFVEVRVAHAGALSLGYCLRPVVLAFDQAVSRKVTICGYTDGHLDVVGLTEELNRLELERAGVFGWIVDGRWLGGHLKKTWTFDGIVGESTARKFAGTLDREEYGIVEVWAIDRDGERIGGFTSKWGGPRNMCNSPQNGGTCLADDTIRQTVARFVL